MLQSLKHKSSKRRKEDGEQEAGRHAHSPSSSPFMLSFRSSVFSSLGDRTISTPRSAPHTAGVPKLTKPATPPFVQLEFPRSSSPLAKSFPPGLLASDAGRSSVDVSDDTTTESGDAHVEIVRVREDGSVVPEAKDIPEDPASSFVDLAEDPFSREEVCTSDGTLYFLLTTCLNRRKVTYSYIASWRQYR